jgi:hypothetical protein
MIDSEIVCAKQGAKLHKNIDWEVVFRENFYNFAIAKQLRKCAAPWHNSSELGSALGLRHFCK